MVRILFRCGLVLQASMCITTEKSYCMHYTLKKKGVNRESSNERKKREGRARMEEEKV
jgi:hypothetical protein